MQGSQLRRCGGGRRFMGRMRAGFAVLCLVPLLAGCIPGFNWGDDAGDDAESASSQTAPALNRSYKTNFLSLQMPSFGAPNLQGQLMPDSGPGLFSAFSTVEARKPAAMGIPASFTALPGAAPAFEPAVSPPEKTLASFYAGLAALASGRRPQPVTVLHFGDDRIADDRFAGALREHLVARFGSAGRGLMMPGLFPVRGMKIDRGGAWTLASAASGAPGPFGITGARMTSVSNEAWMRFTAAQTAADWIEVTFMTGPGFGTAAVSSDGDTKLVLARSPVTGQTSMRVTGKIREVTIRPRGDGPVAVLSVAAGTNTPGVLYSNLGLPGATAWTPGKWTADFASNDLRKLNPDLIMLEYGTREAFDDALDVKQYEIRLRLVLDQIKEWAPQASILIVGPPDAARFPAFGGMAGAQVCRALNVQEAAGYDRMMERSDERLAHWHAPPKLEQVRAALRRVAASSGAFFWDWAKYMGGPCSIHAWASFTPPLATPDHVTLTEAGDGRSARALFTELMAGYDAYQRALQFKAQAIIAAAVAKPERPAIKKRAVKVQQR